MTRQESFKRRIRARMAKTGERYAAARRLLLEQTASSQCRRTWVSEPAITDDKVTAATGRSWNDWCDLLDDWPGRLDGHTAIAAHVQHEHGVDSWWAQTVTVGYERITGLRLPYQMADGTFTAGKSRTVTVDAEVLRTLLLGDDERAELFPGVATELRSKPTTKALRVAFDPGTVLFTIEPTSGGRAKVTVTHERLKTLDEVEEWRFYWTDWLEAIDQVSPASHE